MKKKKKMKKEERKGKKGKMTTVDYGRPLSTSDFVRVIF